MPKYHVHVYKLAEMAEIEVTHENGVKAKGLALSMAKEGQLEFKDSDNEFMALDFEVGEVKGDEPKAESKPATIKGCPHCGSTDIDIDEEMGDSRIMMRCNGCAKTWLSD